MKQKFQSNTEDAASLTSGDLDALLDVFVAEADEHLRTIEESLLAIESSGADPDLLDSLLRVAHSLKGNASCVGYDAVTEVAHGLEDVLLSLKHGGASTDLFSVILATVDVLREMIHSGGVSQASSDIVARLQSLASHSDRHDAANPAPARDVTAEETKPARSRTLRVDVRRLDELLDLTGEIAVARARSRSLLDRITESEAEELQESERQNERLFTELQDLVMKVRMVPIGPVLRPFIRIVRDVANARGKRAHLLIAGDDTEIDTSIVEHLRDPLTHIVRNAIDHGIETPDERVSAGKDRAGTVSIRASHEAGWLKVEVSDDGAGLPRGRIIEKAASLGLDTTAMTDERIERLIFEPGFSTAAVVTELSGRGVGMDVVRRNVEALRGTVIVQSREREGTTVTIRVPLTLAIISGFVVKAGETTCVIPMESVVECVSATGVSGETRTGVIDRRGETLAWIRLSDVVRSSRRAEQQQHFIVVSHHGGHCALLVDDLHGQIEVVVKPLGSYFGRLPAIRGCAVLGDGSVALVVDVDEIFRLPDLRQPSSELTRNRERMHVCSRT